MIKITINGRFESFNEYVNACRRNPYMANSMIKKAEKNIMKQISEQRKRPIRTPINLMYIFYEPNRRRDKSNVASFFIKAFEDSLVELGLIKDDGWSYINHYTPRFYIDKQNPRIEILIAEKVKVNG